MNKSIWIDENGGGGGAENNPLMKVSFPEISQAKAHCNNNWYTDNTKLTNVS